MQVFGPHAGDPLAQPFWDAAQKNKFVLPFERSSGKPCWYPHADCADTLVWREVGGAAQLVAFTVVRAAINPHFTPPYAPALIELDEVPGIRVVTQIVDCDFSELRCGLALELCFKVLEKRYFPPFTAPLFRPFRA